MIKNRVEYELGVMMFNAYNTEYGGLENSSYDILANFEILVTNMDNSINKEELNTGYIAEGENYNINKSELREMFKRDLAILNDY